MISRACLQGSAGRVCACGEGVTPVFSRLPEHESALGFEAHSSGARQPAASRPFIVPGLVKLKQFDA